MNKTSIYILLFSVSAELDVDFGGAVAGAYMSEIMFMNGDYAGYVYSYTSLELGAGLSYTPTKISGSGGVTGSTVIGLGSSRSLKPSSVEGSYFHATLDVDASNKVGFGVSVQVSISDDRTFISIGGSANIGKGAKAFLKFGPGSSTMLNDEMPRLERNYMDRLSNATSDSIMYLNSVLYR